MKKVVNKLEWVLSQSHLEHPKGVSMTVPDESLTVKEILERFRRGQPLSIHTRDTLYDPDSNFDSQDLEEVSRMDITDRSELAQELRLKNARVKSDLEAAQAAKVAAAAVSVVPPVAANAPQ